MISVIMGVYNGEATVSDAIKSIQDQTYSNWEFIICDDCSTDNSFDIISNFAKNDKRIIVIKNKINSGLAFSLNHCLQYAKGNYIARMDCDDISEPTRFEKQIDFLESNPQYHLVGTFMQEFDDNGYGNIIKSKENPLPKDLPKGAPFSHASIIIRSSAMKELNGYYISKHTVRTEDVDLWYRFFAKGFKGTTIPEALYLVRIDDNAYKRRKLKYMFHASFIIWRGCDLLKLPLYYKVYCIKPILSWILPRDLKRKLRMFLIK